MIGSRTPKEETPWILRQTRSRLLSSMCVSNLLRHVLSQLLLSVESTPLDSCPSFAGLEYQPSKSFGQGTFEMRSCCHSYLTLQKGRRQNKHLSWLAISTQKRNGGLSTATQLRT